MTRRRHFTIRFPCVPQARLLKDTTRTSRTPNMSEPSQRPVFLKDLHQPFFLKESPSIVGDEPPIDVGHLARTSRGERDLELQVLDLFDRQAEMLLACLPDRHRAGVASAAHMLAESARQIVALRSSASAR